MWPQLFSETGCSPGRSGSGPRNKTHPVLSALHCLNNIAVYIISPNKEGGGDAKKIETDEEENRLHEIFVYADV